MTSVAGIGAARQRTIIALSDEPDLNFVEVDATESESYQGTAEPTRHPVEAGSDITDHVRRNPESVSLRIVVTDTPIVLALFETPNPVVPGTDPTARVESAFEFLRAIKDAGLQVDISTTLSDYVGFVITDLSVTRDKSTRNILAASITAVEITVAETETVAAPETTPARKRRSSKGKTPKEPTSSPKSQSILFGLFG